MRMPRRALVKCIWNRRVLRAGRASSGDHMDFVTTCRQPPGHFFDMNRSAGSTGKDLIGGDIEQLHDNTAPSRTLKQPSAAEKTVRCAPDQTAEHPAS